MIVDRIKSAGESAADALTGGQYSDPNQSVDVLNPDLFFEAGSFGILDRETVRETGIPSGVSVDEFRTIVFDEPPAPGEADSNARRLTILTYVATFALLAYAFGQLVTFKIGS